MINLKYGISVYSSEEYSLEKNKEYISLAKSYGFTNVFTSLNLPEVNYDSKLEQLKDLFAYIQKLGMELTVDVSPSAFRLLGATSKNLIPFKDLCIDCLRLDYGFSYRDIAEMSQNNIDINIELNASTLQEEEIKKLMKSNVNIKKLRTCHNYYPKPFTAMCYKDFITKTEMIKGYGLEVGVFIPSQFNKRGPIYEGLPSIEEQRYVNSNLSARLLVHLGLADIIYFGDAYASYKELEAISKVDEEVLEIGIVIEENALAIERTIVLDNIHTSRKDSPQYAIRSEESRNYTSCAKEMSAHNNDTRTKYSVTIDNQLFKRYAGELMICMRDMPQDARVNIVGYIPKEERELLRLINPGSKFKFTQYNLKVKE